MSHPYSLQAQIEYEEQIERRQYDRIHMGELNRYQLVEAPNPICCVECGATLDTVKENRALDVGMVCCEFPACPFCGEIDGKPIEAEDRDDSTGYHSIEQRCTLCAPEARV